jgi:hypothetical protein
MNRLHFNKVTWYSKFLTYLFIFGAFPVIVFHIGMKYYQTVEVLTFGYASASEMYMNGTYDAKSFQGQGSYQARIDLEGTWVSDDDDAYVMVIKSNGLFYEMHKGQVKSSGSWLIRDSLSGTSFASQPIGLYLQKNSLNMQAMEDILYYKIVSLRSEKLELSSLDKENTLHFTKHQKRLPSSSIPE